MWGKKKEKINEDLDWTILDQAKPYSPASKKCMLCLTEKYHISFSINNLLNKRNELESADIRINSILQITKTYHHNCLFKTLFPKRL